MTLPTFLGIGALRAGTTWIDYQLRGHSQVYLPARKEVHYFNGHYERGIDWYRAFFSGASHDSRCVAIGEITPAYLCNPRVPGRIHETLPDCRLVAVLRDPVERAWSQYRHSVQIEYERRPFRRYLEEEANVIERGRYAKQLERYLKLFPASSILVLIFEEMMNNRAAALSTIARFLEIDPDGYDSSRIGARVNEAYVPRLRRGYAAAHRLGERVRDLGGDRVVETAKRLGVPRLFGRRASSPQRDREAFDWLASLYRADRRCLEHLLGRELQVWGGGR